MAISLISGPVVEPVSLADFKSQLGLSPYEDSDHLKSEILNKRLRRLLKGARSELEGITRRCFITQTWKLTRDGWPHHDHRYDRQGYRSIVLPKPPYQSIVSFTYIDVTGATQTLAPDQYQLDPGSETQPARLTNLYETPWPILQRVPDNLAITFICGYGDTGSTVPIDITEAILFLAQFYEENGAVTDLPVPRVVMNKISPYINRIS